MNHTLSDSQLEEMIKSAVNSFGPLPPDEKFSLLISALRELQERRKAAMESKPVILYRQVNPVNGMKTYWAELDPEEFRHLKKYADENSEFMTLYRHSQPAPEYPETLPCPVLLEPGLRFGKGIKTSTMLAALSRRAVYESDLAALSPEERVEFQAGIEDVKALIAQPVPVAPVCTCPSGDGSLRWPCPVHPGRSPENPGCWCLTCRPVAINDMRFVVCPDCGNKRCPRANDHRNACTGSNETGQEGSAYPAAPQEVKGE